MVCPSCGANLCCLCLVEVSMSQWGSKVRISIGIGKMSMGMTVEEWCVVGSVSKVSMESRISSHLCDINMGSRVSSHLCDISMGSREVSMEPVKCMVS